MEGICLVCLSDDFFLLTLIFILCLQQGYSRMLSYDFADHTHLYRYYGI